MVVTVTAEARPRKMGVPMAAKRELCAAEEAGWQELIELIESLPPEQLLRPGYNEEGWSVRDLMVHIACWQAEAEQMFQQMKSGTYVRERIDVDALNERFMEACRDLTLNEVRAELFSARTRMLDEFADLPEITEDAREWFVECGPEHYREHLARLREWVLELRSE